MVRDYGRELLAFCKKHDHVVCYGAANYGHTVKHYLEMNHVAVECFIVTQNDLNVKVMDGIPLHDREHLPADIDKYGIILSLTSMYHEEVADFLLGKGLAKEDIFQIDYQIWKYMYDSLLNSRRWDCLMVCPYKLENAYSERAKFLDDNYVEVQVEYMDVGALGSYAGWIGCRLREEKEKALGRFVLYYPYTMFEQEKGNEFRGANGELLFRLYGNSIDIVSEKNIDFWRYYIQTRKNKVHFIDRTEPYRIAANPEYLRIYYNSRQKTKYVYISAEDEKQGEINSQKIGICKTYVCFHARGSYYLGNRKGMLSPSVFDIYRNSDLNTRRLALDYLRLHNIQTVRMGAKEKRQFVHEGVVDYAVTYYDEFMDIWLAKNCKFFICDVSGISALPNLFSKPIVFTNASIMTTRYDAAAWLRPERDVCILKKMWDTNRKRYLSIPEMLDFEVNHQTIDKPIRFVFLEYHVRGIVPVDNTPEEILAVVKEMNERIDGTVQYDELDIELQARYREIVDNYPMKENVLNNWRLGAAFLRENQWLLD